jgi:cytochrome c
MKTRWLIAGAITCLAALPRLGHAQNNGVFNNGIIPTRSVWSGVFTAAQAARGEKVYRGQCVFCHMDFLEGDPSEGPPPLAGDHFMVNWDGASVADLARHMHTQPNDDPSDMYASTAADLVAFILSYNKIPAGNTELSSDRSDQAQIRIEAQKPGS